MRAPAPAPAVPGPSSPPSTLLPDAVLLAGLPLLSPGRDSAAIPASTRAGWPPPRSGGPERCHHSALPWPWALRDPAPLPLRGCPGSPPQPNSPPVLPTPRVSRPAARTLSSHTAGQVTPSSLACPLGPLPVTPWTPRFPSFPARPAVFPLG